MDEPLRPGGPPLTRRAISQYAKVSKGDRLLDVGCGRGDTLRLLTEEYGLICAGIEPDEARFAQACANAPDCDIRRGEAEQLPFADESFHCVLGECSFSLFRDPPRALAEIRRVLKPHGRLVLTDVYAKSGRGATGSGLLRHLYPLAELERLLKEGGFAPVGSEDCGKILLGMLGQLILDYGVEEAYRRIGISQCGLKAGGAGYLIIAAEK